MIICIFVNKSDRVNEPHKARPLLLLLQLYIGDLPNSTDEDLKTLLHKPSTVYPL